MAWRRTRRVGAERLDPLPDVLIGEDMEAGVSEALDVERLAAAIDSLTDAVVVADARGVEVLRNPPALRFRGARHADAIAEEMLESMLARALRGTSIEEEIRLFGPPREVLKMRAAPLFARDEIVGGVVVVRDVSNERRVENVRRDFVQNVSHELKTPIGALALLAETLASGDDPAVIRQLAERMAREADRLARLVDDLLDLSVLEAQESPNREVVPVDVLLSDAVERVHPAADAARIAIRVEPIGRDVVIACDRSQIVSALTNLLDNAVKYSEAGGTVSVTVQPNGARVVVTVRDQGIGIPSRDLERIFERFYRVDQARSRQTGGTGLGLAIVRHVAHAHGGEVTVESIEGEGSTFRIELPARVEPELPPNPGATLEVVPAGHTDGEVT